jgi:site-specific DNA-methyltransferase (adenine-specific)/modification methylase
MKNFLKFIPSHLSPLERLAFEQIQNSLFEGDCLYWLSKFPNCSVDMILCDLPYGTTQNKWDCTINLEKLWKEYERVIKPNGAIVLTSQGVFTAKLILSNERMFKYKIVWEKSKPTNFLNAKKQPLRKHEDICVFYQRQPVFNPQMSMGVPYDKGIRKNQLSGSYGDFHPVHVKSNGGRYPTDVVYFKTAESEGSVWHPTQKPVELARYLIRTFSNPGDLILDNAFGSGSFLLAAMLEGRDLCGIEKNRDVTLFKKNSINYIDVACRRFAEVAPELNGNKSPHLDSLKVYRLGKSRLKHAPLIPNIQ